MDKLKVIENGHVMSVQGFKCSGVNAGIKKITVTKKDVAVIWSETDCKAAGVFTTNRVRSKTVDVDIEHLRSNSTRAVIVNSGNANACCGQRGYDDAHRMTELTAELLGLKTEEVLVCSTGVIGVQLPMDRIENGIKKAVEELKNTAGSPENTIEAIMTTDLVKKNIAVEITLENGKKAVIGAIAKGSGMIHPNMATMLGFVTTDLNIKKEVLQMALREVNEKTFNMISVDRDTSTNDTLIIMANGLAGNDEIMSESDVDYEIFKRGLHHVLEYLAKSIAKDGEGATKLVEVTVKNSVTFEDAKKIAISVITSPLVKTAIFGQDANWGRIIAAVGYSGGYVEESSIDIFVGDVQVCENGMGILTSEEKVNEELAKKELKITIDVKNGNFDATVWGCDLSYDYVKINADYRS